MRGSLILSTLLHVAIIAIIWIGPFDFGHPMIDPVQVIDVELVTENAQRPTEKTEPVPEVKPEKKPPPPKTASLPNPPPPPPAPPSPPQPAAKPEPQEEPVPVPKKEPAAIPVPKEKPEPEPKPEPKPKEVAKAEPVLAPRPRRKPKPPPPEDDFASVLKTVEKLEHRPRKPDSKPEKPKKDAPSFEDQLNNVLNKHARREAPSQPAPLGPKMSMSEIDAVRRQIERCWNPPAGAPEAENLVVEVKLTINRDGSVRRIEFVDTARMSSDSFFRAAAESVRRAIRMPQCTPLKLPLDKYELWKDTTLRFDPRELVGR